MIAEARVAISRVNLRECLVHASTQDVFMSNLQAFAGITTKAQGDERAAEVVESVEKMYGLSAPVRETSKPFIYSDGMAIIPVHGTLLNRFSSCWGFVTGYNFIRAQMNAALADDDVTLLVFDVNSPGGDAAGCFELTEEIRASRAVKPSIAVVDDTGASGGYAIPAACTRMVGVPSATIGSIGVYRLHVDLSGAMDQQGIKYTFVASGEHKVDGNPFEPLSDEVKADWQVAVDRRREDFITDVALSRDLDPEVVRGTEARVYRSEDALALGLIDAVSTATQAVSSFLAELADDEPNEDEEDNMALPKTETEFADAIAAARAEGVSSVSAPDTAKIASDAVKADRERRTSITSLDEAKERPKLAATLADTDSMTAETAKVILASAAVEKPVGNQAKRSGFEEQMDSRGGAGVVADGEEIEGEEDDAAKADASFLASIPAHRRIQSVK